MILSPNQKRLVMAAIPKELQAAGITPNNIVETITTGLKETKENNYGYRYQTEIFFDWSWLYGCDDHDVREPLTRMNPSLREVMDFYCHPKMTTLGSFPFQTLFLESEWNKYNIDAHVAKSLEDDIRRRNGILAHAMLIDTINMIMTGERDIEIPLLVAYMDNGIMDANVIVSERFCRKEVSVLSTQEFLTKWLSTSKGMYDCIEMHRLVFNIHS